MESSKRRTSSASSFNSIPISNSSSSSRSNRETPHLVSSIPQPQTDFSAVSLGNLSKHIPGIRFSCRNPSEGERRDSNSGSFNRYRGSEDQWKSDDLPLTPEVGSSPYLPSSAKLRSCDVFVGVPSLEPRILAFAKWLLAELEIQGLSCFAVDRSKCKDAVGHTIVDRAMDSASFGVVIVTRKSFVPYSVYELKCFLIRKNLVPIFDLGPGDFTAKEIIGRRGELWETHGGELWKCYGGTNKDWKEVVKALSCMQGWKLEARHDTWRDCISEAILLIGRKLRRKSVVERDERWIERAKEEFPYPRNDKFVGRKKELLELELMLFGDLIGDGEDECLNFKHFTREIMQHKEGEPRATVRLTGDWEIK